MPDNSNNFESIYQSYKAKGLSPDEAVKKAAEVYSLALSAKPTNPQSGQEYANREALIKMYVDLWGFTPSEAEKEADGIVARGPTSDVYKARMEMAMNHLKRTDPNSKLFETAAAPFPEASMQNPALIDPQAYAAQHALDERRAKLKQMAQTPVSPGPIKAAAPTPMHLEDANLSSWQSLANVLGYQ